MTVLYDLQKHGSTDEVNVGTNYTQVPGNVLYEYRLMSFSMLCEHGRNPSPLSGAKAHTDPTATTQPQQSQTPNSTTVN